jgi:23S rRNA (pseudouridine1915-N3)-methyltransferase
MRISILSVGKTKHSWIKEGEEEFLKRLQKWCTVEVRELGRLPAASTPEIVAREEEAASIRNVLKAGDVLVLLDETGKQHSSTSFSHLIKHELEGGTKSLVFALGGAYGWPKTFLKEAKYTVSLSPLTFTYQMARIILIEQIYRSFTLIKGIPYHKN